MLTVRYCLLLVTLGLSSPAFAQSSAGSIRGIVADEQGAVLPGVTLTAVSPAAPGSRTAVSDETGYYRLLDLLPGTYTVTVELQGFARVSREDVVVRAGLNLGLNIVMKVGALTALVQVKADTPMLEVEKPVQAVNISGEFQRRLPLNPRRDWSDFLELTPGVASTPLGASNGSYNYSLRGGTQDGHVFQLDGADIGSFRQSLNSYTSMSAEAFSDVQVKTSGVDAATPLGVGVVVNIATNSGTNKLNGAVGASYTPQRWNGNNLAGGTPAISKLFQPDLAVGGPILKDRLWFFGSYRYTHRDTGVARTAAQLAVLQGLKPGFEAFGNENRLHYHYYKANGQIGPSHQYSVFYQRELNPEEVNFFSSAEKLGILSLGGHSYGGRFSTVLNSSTTLRILASYNNKGVNANRSIFDNYQRPGPGVSVFNSTISSGGVLVGNGFLASVNNVNLRVLSPASKTTVQADLTHFRSGWIGTHEFQAGVFMQPRLRSSTSLLYVNGGFADEQAVLRQPGNLAGGYVPFLRRTYDREEANLANISGSDYAVYLQDAWKPTARLTINAGLRIDWLKFQDNLIDVVTFDNTEFGPRLGMTYRLTTDAKNILLANWSRVQYTATSGQFNPGVSSAGAGFIDLYDVNLDGVFETTRVTPAFTRTSTTRQIDPDRHLPYINEWLVGYRRQLPGQLSLEASFVRRSYKDIGTTVDVNGIYEGSVFRGYRDESVNDINQVTNNIWNWPVYSGLELLATKHTSRMQFVGSYTRAFRHMEGTWQPRDPASFIQPDTFPNDKGISHAGASTPNSLTTLASEGQHWRDHILRAGVTYFAPWGLLVASNYSFQSGPYSGPIITLASAPDPRFGPATVTLSNGRAVANPLATTRRFAFPTRGEGQIQAPHLHIWNIRLGRDFKIGTDRLELAFDVFNLTNAASDTQFIERGGNELFNPSYARRADGSFNGTLRQFPRAGQVSVRYVF